ncbi:hypothetical protein [Lignipirellula cremea]|uniref:Uncharacterized protein n=1 Tax=Lignipirellula cremea TaxID=2528010 RepID=A0A518DP68_9BACT|nr:hypothetical protein [Lignipirellula cremea]QDU93630.1 hypothetical protein Pla8534_14100 [Lignipirellula cremea]
MTHLPLPANLTDSIPHSLLGDAERWWGGLDEADRDELALLCDSRKDIFLFETFSADDGPRVTGGKFLPHDNAFGIDDWGADYFQHLLDHPELMIVYDRELRTFHIGCSRHSDARRCFVEGRVPADFPCPFHADACLMHKLRGDRKAVKLQPLTQEIA